MTHACTFLESSAAASVGHLGGKVKKTIKQALNKMDQPSNALPPVHRAPRAVSESSDSGGNGSGLLSRQV